MTRALVVGLLPAQAHRVRCALGHRFKFRFVEGDGHVHRTAEVNVICLDYVTHPAELRLKKLLQPDQILLKVRGLDKNVISQLENLPCRPST